MLSPKEDLGAHIVANVTTLPIADDGTGETGAAVDRTGFMSCVLHGSTGSVTGSPSAQTYNVKLQQSADGATGWTDVADGAITEIDADDTAGQVNVNLRTVQQFVRVVRAVVLTGGSSPTWPCSEVLILGGDDTLTAAAV